LISASNAATNVPTNTNLSWSANSNATNYLVEIASDAIFANIVESATIIIHLHL
jgi:hypothetical protein